MAYVGNTARLCQAIVDGDLEHVKDCLDQDGADPNRRDYTGRTPLQLAVRCSTPEIVQCLVDKGARLIARLADGKTALHLAAERGSVEIVKILMDKSTANEAEEEGKKDLKRQVKTIEAQKTQGMDEVVNDGDDDEDDGELVGEVSDGGTLAATEGFFMKMEGNKGIEEPLSLDDDAGIADVYDVDVLAWDKPFSAVHFAIMAGHDMVVKLLCEVRFFPTRGGVIGVLLTRPQEYGAAVLLPIKYFSMYGNPSAVILTLALAMTLPVDKARSMVTTLLSLGATSAQGDMNGVTPFFSLAGSAEVDLLETLLEHDKTGSSRAIGHMSFLDGWTWSNPLLAAIGVGDAKTVSRLLDAGAAPNISTDSWLKSAKSVNSISRTLQFRNTEELFRTTTEQPLIAALRGPNLSIALDLLERGADPNTETKEWHTYSTQVVRWRPVNPPPKSALALARSYIGVLKEYDGERNTASRPLKLFEGADSYLNSLERDSWFFWAASVDVLDAKKKYNDQLAKYEGELERVKSAKGVAEKTAAILEAIEVLEKIEQKLVAMLGKDLEEKDEPNIQDAPKPEPVEEFTKTYEFVPRFLTGNPTTETENKAYVPLFEAAWRGDLATIKKLTLAAWKDANGVLQPPLLASASYHGHSTNSPFSLAFLRGHHKVARAILEIIQAQYSEDEGEKVHYFPREDDCGCDFL